ncbi:MAG: hypothetical protein BV456_12310 [Thermoplasmata archaeon M8B2D]|nr:MAG: hypothetical protein BV456_12310 [Thermoplasmata archaeon M8B2D]
MNEKMDLKKFEKKAWVTFFQDGMWDIFLGFILLSFGIIPFLEEIGVPELLNYLLFFGLPYLILYMGKKFITVPRIGHVKFGVKREKKKKKTAIVLIFSVIFGFVVLLLTITNAIPFIADIHTGAVLFSVNAIIVLSLMAYFLDFNRLYLYGWFFAASIALIELSRPAIGTTYDNIIGFGSFGIIMIIIVSIYLIRFLQKYPLPLEETLNGN